MLLCTYKHIRIVHTSTRVPLTEGKGLKGVLPQRLPPELHECLIHFNNAQVGSTAPSSTAPAYC